MKSSIISNEKGFTLIELLIVVGVIACIVLVLGVGIYGTAIKGNYWYSDSGVARELKLEYPEAGEILKTKRNIWSYSEVVVTENGERKTYYLDTDILWNYEFHDNPDD